MKATRKFERTNAISGDIIDDGIAARWLVNSVVINRDLSMGLGWKVQFPYLPIMDEDDKIAWLSGLRSMLHTLPDHFDLQFIFTQHHDAADILARACQTDKVNQPIVRAIIEENVAQLQAGFAEKRLRLMEGYIILTRKNTISSGTLQQREAEVSQDRPSSLLGSLTIACSKLRIGLFGPELAYRFTQSEYDASRNELAQVADGMAASLLAIGAEPRLLSNQECLNLLFKHWNPDAYDRGVRARDFVPTERLPITEYFLRSPWSGLKNGTFYMDGQYHALLTVRTPPAEMTFTQWDGLMYASGMHRMKIIVNIQRGNLRLRLKTLKEQLKISRTEAEKDPEFVKVVEDIESELLDLSRDQEKVWEAMHIVHIWGDTPEQVDLGIRAIKAYGAANDDIILTEETHAAWDYWVASQPFWTRDSDRFRFHSYNTTQLITQLPLGGHDVALGKKIGAMSETTDGSLFNLMFHSRDFENANVQVLGGAGSGKSFLVNSILAQMAPHNPSVVVVDLGNSFRAMCLAQGGQYVDMDAKTDGYRINPFYLPAGTFPDEDQISMMVAFLEKLIVDAVKEGRLLKEDIAILEQALVQAFQRADGREVTLSMVKDTIGAFSGGGPRLAARLSPWTGQGRYAKLFDGPTQMSPSGNFTVFDLSRVVDNVDLCAVMFASIIQQVAVLGNQDPGRMKFLVFDEAWRLLEDPVVSSFIVSAYRTLRKAGFSVIGISQGIEEFTRTGNKTAIINNIAHYIILRQGEKAAELVAQEFGLNSTEQAILTRLQSRSGHFSQSLIVQRLNNGTRRSMLTVNRPSPLSYWICTTNPADKGLIEEYRRRGLSHLDALKQLARDMPQGAGGRVQAA